MILSKANILLVILFLGTGGLRAQTDLIISEYLENGGDKCIEIHNPTSSVISLADYRISIWNNGSPMRQTLRNLAAAGNLAAGGTILSCRSAASIASIPPDIDFATGFTGNDAVAITKGPANDIVDLFGNIGCDPGGSYSEGGIVTEDVILRRNVCVLNGVTNDPPGVCPFPTLASEWTTFPLSATEDLGSHSTNVLVITEVTGSSPMDCNGGTGSIAVTMTGINDGEDYSLNFSRNGASIQETLTAVGGVLQLPNLVAANYSDFKVEDLSGTCSSTVDETIVEITTPEGPSNVFVNPTNPESCGGNGTINVTANGINLSYSLDGGDWQQSGTFLVPEGEYQVTVRSDNAPMCITDPETVELTEPDAPMINATPNHPSCGSTGSITLSGVNAGSEYFVEWFDPIRFFINRLPSSGNELIIEDLPPGNYTDIRIIEQSTFCESNTLEGPIVLNGAMGPTIEVTGADPSSCGANGTMTVSGLTAGTFYDLSFERDGTVVQQSGLPANGGQIVLSTPLGNYTNFQASPTGSACASNLIRDTVSLMDPAGPTISATLTNPDLCGVDGLVTLSGVVSGTVYQVNYIEDTIALQQSNVVAMGDQVEISLAPGRYTNFQVVDLAGCSSNLLAEELVIEEPAGPVIDVSSRAPLKCGGDATLIIEGLITNEIYDVAYLYNSQASETKNVAASSDGTIELTVPTGAFKNIQVLHVASSCVSNLLAGTTNVFDLDAPTVSVSGQNPMSCGANDGLLRILGLTSGTPYDLAYDSNGVVRDLEGIVAENNSIILPVSAGIYTNLQVTDPQTECRSNLIFYEIILSAPGATINIEGSDPTICGGEGRLTIKDLDRDGLYDVVFEQDGEVQSRNNVSSGNLEINFNVPAGEYTNVQVTERSTRCSSNLETEIISISNGDAPQIQEVEVSEQLSCGGNINLEIDATGPNLEYSINGGADWSMSPEFERLPPGEYDVAVRVAGSSNCVVEWDKITVPDGALPGILDVNMTPIEDCDGAGEIVINAIGSDLQYSIDGGQNWDPSNVFENLTADTYQVIVRETGSDLCVTQGEEITFEQPETPEISSVVQQPLESCNGTGDLAINAEGLETGRSYRLDLDSAGKEMQINLVAQSNMMLLVTGLAEGLYRNLQLHDQMTTCASNVVSEVNVVGAFEATLLIDSITNLSSCAASDGEIFLMVNEANFNYVVDITINGMLQQPSQALVSDANRIITIPGLASGSYSIVVSTADCVSSTQSTVLSAPDAPELQIQSILLPESCGSETGGIILGTPEAGQSYEVSYVLNGEPASPVTRSSSADSTIVLEDLIGGNYTNIAISLDGCTSAAVNTVLVDPPIVPQLLVSPNNSCEDNKGSIGLTNLETNTTYGLSYDSLGILIDRPALTSAGGGIFINNLPSGFYQNIVLSRGTCQSDTIFLVEITGQGGLGSFEPVVISPTSCGGSDGRIIFDSLEPMANVSADYLFDGMPVSIADEMTDNDGVFQITGLSAGIIEVLSISFDACSTEPIDLILTDPELDDIEVEAIDPMSCAAPDGAIRILLDVILGENYTVSYTYNGEIASVALASSGVDELLLQNLAAGTYSEIQVSLNNCFSNVEQAVLMGGDEVPTFTIGSVTDPTGCGATDGTMVLNDLEASQDYELSYSLGGVLSDAVPFRSEANGQFLISDLGAGDYTDITVSLAGCQSAPRDTMLAAAGVLEVTLDQVDPSGCTETDGVIIIGNLADGLYTITYDSNDVTRMIDEVPSNGEIRIENLGIGEYRSMRISDGSCTSGVLEVVLGSTGGFGISQRGKSNPSVCGAMDGSFTITQAPQDIAYDVYYSKDGIEQEPFELMASGGRLVIPDLGKGSYDQIYISALGCESFRLTAPVVLEDPPGPELNRSFQNPRGCDSDDGSISLTNLPGSTMFRLNYDSAGIARTLPFETDASGSFELDSLAAGTYTKIEVMDQDMCVSDTFSFTLEAPGEIAAAVRFTPPRCMGEANGSATVQVMGSQDSLTFTWSHDATDMDSIAINLPTGMHSVTVSQPGRCNTVLPFQLMAPDSIEVSITKTDEQTNGANDGTVIVEVTSSGTYNFQWSNDSSDEMLAGLAPGTYYLTVTNENGCEAFDSVTIVPFGCPNLVFDITSRRDVVCSGDSTGMIVITPTEGQAPFTYQWSHSETEQDSIAEGLAAGPYNLTITDASGCPGTSPPLEINDLNPPLTFELDTTPITMAGNADGMASVIVSGGVPGYSYRWSTGETSQQIADLSEGMFSVVVTDSLGCTDSVAFTLSADECLLEVDTNLISTSCVGSEDARMELQISGGDNATITWSHNPNLRSSIADSLAVGDYTVTIVEDANCSREISFSVIDPSPIQVSYNVSKNEADTSNFDIEAIVSGGRPEYSITWEMGEDGSMLSNRPAGEYSLVVVDGSGCIAIDSVVVEEPQCALAIRETITDSGCDGVSGAIDLELIGASGGFVLIEWSDPSLSSELSIEGLSEGTYIVEVNDAGCATSDTFEIEMESAIVPSFSASRDICQANSVFVFEFSGLSGGGTPLSITLANMEITAGFRDTLAAGEYMFSVTDDQGCSFDSTIIVGEEAAGEYLVMPVDTQILLGNSVTLIGAINGDSNAVTPQWSIGDSILCSGCWSIEVAPQETRMLEFAVVGDGCTVSDLVTVFVDQRDLFFVPNAFTLNGDGVNDRFIVHDGRGLIRDIRFLKVYDRSGREVYLRENFPANLELDDFADAFDDFISPAVFMYLLEVELFNGEVQTLTGDFSLLR